MSVPDAPYGNYHRYYATRYKYGKADAISVKQDPRVRFVKANVKKRALMLDIGCNSGLLTAQIAKQCRAKVMLGVDIDAELVRRANLKHAQSPQRAAAQVSLATDWHVDAQADAVLPYFSPAMVAHGAVDEAVLREYLERERIRRSVLPTVSFSVADVCALDDLTLLSNQKRLDVILCFSTTKWLHLHHGDARLQQFFHQVYAALADDGVFVLEAQPMSSYRKHYARTLLQQANLQFAPDQFRTFLLDTVGFSDVKESLLSDLQHTPAAADALKGFGNRTISVFYKKIEFQEQPETPQTDDALQLDEPLQK